MAEYLIQEKNLISIADKTRKLTNKTEGLSIAKIIELIEKEKTYLDATLSALEEKGIEVPEGTTNAEIAELISNLSLSGGTVSPGLGPLDFSYTGTYEIVDEYTDETNWEIKLKTTGDLVFNKEVGLIDVFLVGGGGAGRGYGGGGGGYTTNSNYTPVKGETYSITVGDGALTTDARGGTTSAFNAQAEGGYTADNNGGDGGSGGGGSGGSGGVGGHNFTNRTGGTGGSDGNDGTKGFAHGYGSTSKEDQDYDAYSGGAGQHTTTRAFGESERELYAGGGGGNCNAPDHDNEGGGGQGGGGNGGYTAGTANTGGGGGGGGFAGGSGIVIIRNHREA